jgi:hypothetical protein
MTQAELFPEPWGFTEIVKSNSSDIINASLNVWSSAGDTGANAPIVSTLAIGAIPILLIFYV